MMNSFFRRILQLFLFVCISFSVHAQEPYYQNYSFSDGYSFRSVYSLLENKSGFIWFTTDEGLFSYDGTKFKNYKNSKQTSFSGTYIQEDKFGRIWYQTFDGLFYYLENNKLKPFQTIGSSMLFSFQISDQYVFTLEEKHIGIYDLRTLRIVKTIPKKSFEIVTATLQDGELYYIQDFRLRKINKRLQDELISEKFLKSNARILMCPTENSVLISQMDKVDKSIYQVKENRISKLCSIHEDLLVQNIQYIDHKIYLSTTNGVRIIDPKSPNKINAYLKSNSFSAVVLDRKNNLWLSSPNAGLFLLANIKLTKENSFNSLPVRLCRIGEELVFTSKNSTLNWFNTKKHTFRTEQLGNVNAEGYYFDYFPKLNTIVIGSSDGYTSFRQYHGTSSKTFKSKVALKKVIQLDHKYFAVIGTGVAGFLVIPGNEKLTSKFDVYLSKMPKIVMDGFSIYRIDHSAFRQRGKSMVYDAKTETLYLSTAKGLFTWKKGVVKEVFIHHSPVVLKSIFQFNGKIIGLNGTKNLIKISPFTETESKAFEILAKHTDIQNIRVEKEYLLIQTQHYLYVFKQTATGKIKELQKLDISNIEIFDFCLQDQIIWMSSVEGLLKWDFYHTTAKNQIGTLNINQLLVNDISIPLKGKNLNYDQNDVSVKYSILDFGNKTIERVYYKLNNGRWQKMESNAQTINFSALAPNHYTIRFKGIVYGKPVYFDSIQFTISPPFWSTWWFITLIVFILAGLVFAFYKYQINKIILKNKLINEKITLENNLNKSMLTALKSQMNPHFFYNVLNSIQGYVLTGEQQKASESIGLFSDLSRAVLESSRMNEISLHDELELLESYLKLECMRMPKISYEIVVAPNLRLHDLFLPPMIVQPIVENAVKHGLANKNGNGKIILQFGGSNQLLSVEITDDGIGRVAASKIEAMRTRKGSSFSTTANNNRIDLLNMNFDAKITYSIEDLVDSQQQPCGTKVCLFIPQHNEAVSGMF